MQLPGHTSPPPTPCLPPSFSLLPSPQEVPASSPSSCLQGCQLWTQLDSSFLAELRKRQDSGSSDSSPSLLGVTRGGEGGERGKEEDEMEEEERTDACEEMSGGRGRKWYWGMLLSVEEMLCKSM